MKRSAWDETRLAIKEQGEFKAAELEEKRKRAIRIKRGDPELSFRAIALRVRAGERSVQQWLETEGLI